VTEHDDENDICARLLANDLAMNVAVARLLLVIAPPDQAADEDPERWDGLA
jgi:hypothetical protein